MPLVAGTELGHYQIQSKLGEGGMGEVYLAFDSRLGRKVALKILPTELASNQDRMRRFTQEAKAAALGILVSEVAVLVPAKARRLTGWGSPANSETTRKPHLPGRIRDLPDESRNW